MPVGRLLTVASLINFSESLIDIGCDHGKLCEFVLKNRLADNVIACDISEPSLNKAKELLKEWKNIEFLNCDGTDAIARDCKTVVICGLGGREIAKIISHSKAETLILQPQNHVADVRRKLNALGYKIIKDILACERGKFYDILQAIKGEQQLQQFEYEWGTFITEKNPLKKQKLIKEKAKLLVYPSTKENLQKMEIILEVEKWQM